MAKQKDRYRDGEIYIESQMKVYRQTDKDIQIVNRQIDIKQLKRQINNKLALYFCSYLFYNETFYINTMYNALYCTQYIPGIKKIKKLGLV